MKQWKLRVHEPSGESWIAPIQGVTTIGRGHQSQVILKDPTVASDAAVVMPIESSESSPFWIRIQNQAQGGRLGDLCVREAHWPMGIPLILGETKLTLESPGKPAVLPDMPKSVRPWLTVSEEGKNLLWLARKAASTSLSVYVAGETGTGKEVLAQLIHAWSDLKGGPFVPLHCGALPIALAESELFGHVKGAFTGAVQQRPGALMQAHGGTLFLDEIGDLPLDIQVKLLRFLENGEIKPVGSDRTLRADVRIVCATHHPLQKLVEEGKFRRDLFFRLASVTLNIPTLRSRPDDIKLLSEKFSSEFNRSISQRAMFRLQAHTWPGNVRELRHAIERASGLSGPFSPILSEEAFDFLLTSDRIQEAPEMEWGAPVLSIKEMERVLLLKALKLSNGNRAQAAKILGVARSTLFEMLKRHRIQGPKAMAVSE
jgi:transcriptional regulator with PAS, ATPase and Fis domain